VLYSGAAAAMVLLLVLLVLQDRLREEWFLRRLRTGDSAAKKAAVNELAAMGSARAIDLLLEGFRREVKHPGDSSRGGFFHFSAFRYFGSAAVPGVAGELGSESSSVRAIAAQILGDLGLHALPAVDALTRLAEQDPDPVVRRCAAEALRSIGAAPGKRIVNAR
jgi:HEAT repeat protein